jgi:hypothetical protein
MSDTVSEPTEEQPTEQPVVAAKEAPRRVGVAILRLASYQTHEYYNHGLYPLPPTQVKKQRLAVEAHAWGDHLEEQFGHRLKLVREIDSGIYMDAHLVFPYSPQNVLLLSDLFRRGQITGFALPESATYVSQNLSDHTEEFNSIAAALDKAEIEWVEGTSEEYNWKQQNTNPPTSFTEVDAYEFGITVAAILAGK